MKQQWYTLFLIALLFSLDVEFCAAAPVPAHPAAPERTAGTVLKIQPSSTLQSLSLASGPGNMSVELINLNPSVHRWYLLTVPDEKSAKPLTFHLETASRSVALSLDDQFHEGLIVTIGQTQYKCPLWSKGLSLAHGQLEEAARQPTAFSPICNNSIFVRNKVRGHRTAKEWVTELLRDKIPQGDDFIAMVKKTIFEDSFKILSTELLTSKKANAAEDKTPRGPLAARLAPEATGKSLIAKYLGMRLAEQKAGGAMTAGSWYATAIDPNIYVSVIKPDLIDKELLASYKERVARLDGRDMESVSYLVAFDLSAFEMGFAVGTEHPRVDFSPRARASAGAAKLGGGPDGFATVAPLVKTGMMNPVDAARAAATFAGGFKRHHGAFKWGPLGDINHGSHYGFIENGVQLSKLIPGLSTFASYADGTIAMKTWTENDNQHLDKIVYARQNGVALIEEYDSAAGQSVPGPHVSNWMLGNWSGTAGGDLRALRGGICLTKNGNRSYLVYGYFSSATPSAMARVFQAYHCHYAFHLDMNSPEYTYLAIYPPGSDPTTAAEHLTTGMPQYDKNGDKQAARFRSFPDNRDFFFLLRKTAGGH
jgi:hypothetical protein